MESAMTRPRSALNGPKDSAALTVPCIVNRLIYIFESVPALRSKVKPARLLSVTSFCRILPRDPVPRPARGSGSPTNCICQRLERIAK
jgi:hypothetical protein